MTWSIRGCIWLVLEWRAIYKSSKSGLASTLSAFTELATLSCAPETPCSEIVALKVMKGAGADSWMDGGSYRDQCKGKTSFTAKKITSLQRQNQFYCREENQQRSAANPSSLINLPLLYLLFENRWQTTRLCLSVHLKFMEANLKMLELRKQ